MNQQQIVAPDDVHVKLTNTARRSSQSHSQRHTIRCFKHCTKFVFCFELPDCCPICEDNLLTSEVVVPPFVYPSPLKHEHMSNLAILVRPSRGKSFLHDYANGDDLHCGLLDEEGIVHDFQERGLTQSDEWFNCIFIPIDYTNHDMTVKERLTQIESQWIRLFPQYHPKNANCFSFVHFCLKSLGLYMSMNEAEFISEVVLPRSSQAARYISVYRQLVTNGGVCVKDAMPS